MGFPGSTVGKMAVNTGDLGFIPGLGRSSGEVKWQPIPVLLPREFHEQRSLVDYSSWGCRVGHD